MSHNPYWPYVTDEQWEKMNVTFSSATAAVLAASEKKTPSQMSLDEMHAAWWNVATEEPATHTDNPCSSGCDWKVYDSGFSRFEYCARCNKERPA
jgi:hypothetical protein